MMADAWRDDRLTMQTLRDLYANLNHAEPGAAAAAGGAPPAGAGAREQGTSTGRLRRQSEQYQPRGALRS